MDKKITKTYDNGEISVVWQPHKCIHSAICFRGLPAVFDPTRRPWVTIDGASTETIIAQVDLCPSGALSYHITNEQEEVVANETVVEVLPNGPLLVYGNLAVKDYAGNEQKKSKVTAFCRCGSSKNKPYCDGTHAKVGFSG